MSEVFETREEAETFRVKSIGKIKASLKYCPLAQDRCKTTECMAFYPGYIYENKGAKKPFRVHGGRCQSPLITGTIEVEQ